MAPKKYQPPAKAKYDKSHPIISIRLTPDLKKKLDDIEKVGHQSVADVLGKAVELQTPSMMKLYFKGYESAQTKYAVTYDCSKCGKMLTIQTLSKLPRLKSGLCGKGSHPKLRTGPLSSPTESRGFQRRFL